MSPLPAGRRAALVVALVGASVAVVVAAPTPARAVTTVRSGALAAVAVAERRGMVAGVAVIDTVTGELTTAGRSRREFAAASVAKVLIATRLLLAGRMTGATALQAGRMIRRSDNAAAFALYPQAGGARLVPWLARHYRIPDLGAPALQPGVWGTTQLTPVGLARFYAAVRADPKVWPWLAHAMHHGAAWSSAAEPNDWGLAAAASGVAFKNGWALHPDLFGRLRADIDTTGFVQHDRYAVVLLSDAAPSYYFARGESIITRAARQLVAGVAVSAPSVCAGGHPAAR